MARFSRFRGTVYNPDRVDLDSVVAPPYDVVGPAERAELAARSPYNAILVELPEPEGDRDRYQHAADLWTRWHSEEIVARAPQPTLYAYRMTFTEEDGSTRTTNGVLGALGLDPGHTGEVLPHERTISKDKHDRLSLLKAARTNFSPIWGLSLALGLGEWCERAAETPSRAFRATDSDGTVHECWAVTNAELLSHAEELVGSTPVLIADGHHRYETACAYAEEAAGSPGSGAVLALVVELSERELAVQAIHRLLTGVLAKDLPGLLAPSFELAPGAGDPIELRDSMVKAGALGLVLAGESFLMSPRPELLAAAGDDLDSSLLGHALENVRGIEVRYQHGAREVARAVSEGEAAAAVLLRPVSVEQIARTAHGGRRMPPKSTFFYPKPRTGMVFRELDAG